MSAAGESGGDGGVPERAPETGGPSEPGSSERGEHEIEALLRRVPAERPDPRRQARARAEFLAAGTKVPEDASRQSGLDRMGRVMAFEEHDGFVAWLAAQPPAAPVRPEARSRARLAFLSAVASDVRPLRRERRSVRLLVLAGAAAAIVAVTFFLPEPERWSVRIEGPLRFAEREYVPGDEARLAADLEGSGTVESSGGRAFFTLGANELVVELAQGGSLNFPPLPELDGIAPLEFELAHGEAYLRTASAYPGNPIVLHTELADVMLAGTVVGVLVEPAGTCVCVAEGRVRVADARASGRQEIAARTSLRLYTDPSVAQVVSPFPEDDDPEAEHTRPLIEFGKAR